MDDRRDKDGINTAKAVPLGRRATVVDLELTKPRPGGEEVGLGPGSNPDRSERR